MSELATLTRLMLSTHQHPPARRRTPNPRPPGVSQGGASEVVFEFLAGAGGYCTHAQIVWATGRTDNAVNWALIKLRQWGKIRRSGDPRNPRYYRYCVVEVENDN
ncbi:MAG TPA: hypothetical protein VLG93_08550 [Sulfuricaulis sp.]|nr:hypothetical protein [Sulfuricaulis sp.]